MITLETGVPGAGKTLYCVDKLVRSFVGSVVLFENESGVKSEIKRTIYTNINGLLLEHEKIGPGTSWVHDAKTDEWTQPKGADTHGLNNWHEWAKPGSIIIYDEIQKPWPKAASGSKVPPCITALETHRHMGVDFVCLTQHPMLIHGNLVQLVGRHLHVRRMGNMSLAIVYEWDSCSKTLLYKNALAKSPYRYDKAVFDLYKSAELHTKTPRKIPTLVFGAIFGLVALVGFAPSVYSRISERINPPPVVAKTALSAIVAQGEPSYLVDVKTLPPPLVVVPPVVPVLAPEIVVIGCGRMRDVCKCFDKQGSQVVKPLDFCSSNIGQLGAKKLDPFNESESKNVAFVKH